MRAHNDIAPHNAISVNSGSANDLQAYGEDEWCTYPNRLRIFRTKWNDHHIQLQFVCEAIFFARIVMAEAISTVPLSQLSQLGLNDTFLLQGVMRHDQNLTILSGCWLWSCHRAWNPVCWEYDVSH